MLIQGSITNQQYEMPVPVVVYADFESVIDDKNRHKPIMLSCLAVSCIPAIDTQLRVFHAPHESEEDLRPFMEYLVQLHKRVWKGISSMRYHWRAHRRSRRTFVQQPCVPSATRNWRTTRYDITHMWQVNTPQERERYATSKPVSTFAPVVPNAISNSRSRRTIDCQSTSTMAHTMISRSSWR